jgi:hypothetical protein
MVCAGFLLKFNGYRAKSLLPAAFLLNNGKAYHIAHLFGILEYLFWSHFWPRKNWWYMQSGWIYLGKSQSCHPDSKIVLLNRFPL